MQLAVHQDDAEILLKEKNQLNEAVLDKYRVAGQIAQTGLKYITALINDSYHLGKTEAPYTCQELCVLGDSMLVKLLKRVYNNEVREKGIAQPVSIELNEIVGNFAPEIDDNSDFTFKPGDILTISLGIQIDGYTASVSHTVVIYPPGILVDNELKPSGPLLGSKADAICAAHIATETVVSLLGTSMSPEKLPQQLRDGRNSVGGAQIRRVVDSIAESFNCVVVPGSKVRRIRRFLAGQAEGVVAERDFKGVVWHESDQEATLLQKFNQSDNQDLTIFDKLKQSDKTDNSSAIATDDFVVVPGEVYTVDIKMCSIGEFKELGLITLEEIDSFTGTNNKENEFKSKSTIFVRDYAVNYQLKLKSSRSLLGKIDKQFTVYPFKLSYTSAEFPLESAHEIQKLQKDIRSTRLGLSELTNRYLVNAKPTQVAKFVPLQAILKAANPSGRHGIDALKPTLPGMEVPLPLLGISALRLKSLLKYGVAAPTAREMTTVVLNSHNSTNEVLRLTGGKTSSPNWVHSEYELHSNYKDAILQLMNMATDKRFGIKVKECNLIKPVETTQKMSVD